MKRPIKTLTEVIKSFERCPYSKTKTCLREKENDTLYYLKEYEKFRKKLLKGMRRLEEKENMYIRMISDYNKNQPLTWEEIKKEQGKPVWLVSKNDLIRWSGWVLIGYVKDDRVYFNVSIIEDDYFHVDECCLLKSQYGHEWNVYKRELKE